MDRRSLAVDLTAAFAAYEEGAGRAQRVRAQPGPGVTAMILVPGLAADVPAYTVKVHAKNPQRQPALTGVICLHDLITGDLLAVLDSGWLTALRTGVGAAVGTHHLARPGSTVAGVIGAGVQGTAQLGALALLRNLTAVHVHDIDPGAAQQLVRHAEAELELAARSHNRATDVAAHSDMLLVATWPRDPVLSLVDVQLGTHVTSLGSDEAGKTELDPSLLAAALLVTDDQSLATDVGLSPDVTIGEVLRGEHPGRTSDHQITVYSPVGLPMQDCVVAWHAYRKAMEQGLGTSLSMET